MSKDANRGEPLPVHTMGDLASDFEWSTELSIFDTLLEIAPVIQVTESIAIHLLQKNDPRASELYEQLNQIMIRTNEIVLAASERSAQKHQIYLCALQGIKDNLANINEINSR